MSGDSRSEQRRNSNYAAGASFREGCVWEPWTRDGDDLVAFVM